MGGTDIDQKRGKEKEAITKTNAAKKKKRV